MSCLRDQVGGAHKHLVLNEAVLISSHCLVLLRMCVTDSIFVTRFFKRICRLFLFLLFINHILTIVSLSDRVLVYTSSLIIDLFDELQFQAEIDSGDRHLEMVWFRLD
jgi:hypothetical protein